jgi:hypothetical protein
MLEAASFHIPVVLLFMVFFDGCVLFLLVCAARSLFFAGPFAGFFIRNVLFAGGIHLVLFFCVVHFVCSPDTSNSIFPSGNHIATNEPDKTCGRFKHNILILQVKLAGSSSMAWKNRH